ncbi:MAG: hypothetical protein SGARI_001400, partial [Bacillariaceae sp.]
MTVVSKDSKDKENDDRGGPAGVFSPAAVRVYVRSRPMIGEEPDHAEMQYKIHNQSSSLKIQMPAKKQPQINPSFAV